MMKLFIDNVSRIFSKDMLYDLLWGEAIIDEDTITIYVNRLRAKIEEDPARSVYIQVVRGLDYRSVVQGTVCGLTNPGENASLQV